MSKAVAEARHKAKSYLGLAVHRNEAMTWKGLHERIFTRAFEGLVYPQIWEDPEIDMAALAIRPGDHIVAIASGGCNVLSYLTASPTKITAVDLNRAHVALSKLKLTAARRLPNHASFFAFFGRPESKGNVAAYDRYIAPYLDRSARAWWEGRDLLGRRRIGAFARGFYRHGLLGRFIGAAHFLGRLHGVNPRLLLEADTLERQREIFERHLAPVLRGRIVKWLASSPVSLVGLGIPPSQYDALAGRDCDMAATLSRRLERLACGFRIRENYFAAQAFGRSYEQAEGASLPPYLQERNFESLRARAGRVEVRHAPLTDVLRGSAATSFDCFVLLDAQDWMTDADLIALWTEINRTARPGARVIFRTAAEERLLPGRVPNALLERWRYDVNRCADFSRRDRSAIYGAFHLYGLDG